MKELSTVQKRVIEEFTELRNTIRESGFATEYSIRIGCALIIAQKLDELAIRLDHIDDSILHQE